MIIDECFTSIRDLKSIPESSPTAFTGVYLVKKKTQRTTKTQKPFIQLELGDATGSFACNIFDNMPFFPTCQDMEAGSIVKTSGQTDHFNGNLSPRMQYLEIVPKNEAQQEGWMDLLVESSSESVENLWQELMGYIEAIPHEGLKATTHIALTEIESVFKTSPAAISMHHAYKNGLLEHTTHVARACNALLPLYLEVDPSLAMAGAILHDIGKTIEYQGEDAYEKSRTGILQGHVVLGYRMVRKAGLQAKLSADLLERLEHIILSHQGELEWGAAAMASTPEAVFVSMIDNLDAKMGIVQHALRHADTTSSFSSYHPALKTSVLTQAPDL